MSTRREVSVLGQALSGVPDPFKTRLVDSYESLKRNQRESRYDAAGLDAGKFCEVVLRLIQHAVIGSYTPFGRRIANFADDCRTLITSTGGAAPESLRVVVPRALVFMYTMRNKRGIGHVGGDVEANRIDSTTLARTADWVVAELVRVYHGLSLEEAQDIVDGMAIKDLPLVWEVAGRRRVLDVSLSAREQTLLLLYGSKDSAVLVEDLCSWVEYARMDHYKDRVLGSLHTDRLIEFDREDNVVYLSPTGAREVESVLLPRLDRGRESNGV
jgi:hypothetical protein